MLQLSTWYAERFRLAPNYLLITRVVSGFDMSKSILWFSLLRLSLTKWLQQRPIWSRKDLNSDCTVIWLCISSVFVFWIYIFLLGLPMCFHTNTLTLDMLLLSVFISFSFNTFDTPKVYNDPLMQFKSISFVITRLDPVPWSKLAKLFNPQVLRMSITLVSWSKWIQWLCELLGFNFSLISGLIRK